MATMKDVARRAGVSIATVSSVLSGAAYVSPPLRARVEAAVTELGYARNAVARSLKRGHSSLLGLIVPDITNPFFTSLVDEVQQLAAADGYTVLLGLSNNDAAREPHILALMRSHQAAGTIMCPTGEAASYRTIALQMGAMKLVLADNAPPETDTDTVVMDNGRAAELAAAHIFETGHRRIAVMAGPAHQFVAQVRQEAFVRALARRGVAFDAALVVRGDFREQEAHGAALALLSGRERPTAIFVANNLMLIGVMRAIAARGLRVPHDISVVSIDDFAWAAAFQPALTVVRQPIAAMAAAAHRFLMRRIAGANGPPEREVLAPELVIRQSCARPPDGS
jgi:LacI family transcriptional regulator